MELGRRDLTSPNLPRGNYKKGGGGCIEKRWPPVRPPITWGLNPRGPNNKCDALDVTASHHSIPPWKKLWRFYQFKT